MNTLLVVYSRELKPELTEIFMKTSTMIPSKDFENFTWFHEKSLKILIHDTQVYEKQIQWKTTLQISSVKLLSDFANTVYSSKQGKRNF